uniref:Tudor domain-containing protein 5 n=1 Tax=Callorhinchus milii TaxID=7868 RepID=V9KH94_CALMI
MSDQEVLLDVLKKELRSLLISAQGGLSPVELESDYYKMMGKRLPLYALGYRSVLELITDMPDAIKIHTCGNGSLILKGNGDATTKGIEEMVAKSRIPSKTKRNLRKPRYDFTQKQGFLPRRCNSIPVLPALVKCEIRELLLSFPDGILLSDFDKAFVKKYGRPFQCARYGFYSLQEVLKTAADDIVIQQTRRGSLLLLKVQNRECFFVQGEWHCQSIANHPVEAESTSVPLIPLKPPTQTFQKQSLEPLDPDNVPGSNTGLEYFDGGMKKLVKDLKAVLLEKGVGGTIDPKVKEKVWFTVAQRPDGLLASRLPVEFKDIFGQELPLKELGFYSVTELVAALSDIFYVERDVKNQDWLIFDIKRHQSLQKQVELQLKDKLSSPDWNHGRLSDSQQNEMNMVEMVTKILYLPDPEFEIPPDAMQDGNLYRTPELEGNSFVSVFVESVVSPSQFYVRFYGKDASEMLEDLMIGMRRCYSYEEVSERYVMPDFFIRQGQVCCVRNPNDVWWYRVVIHQLLDADQVEVFYVDFGDISSVERSRLRFLKCCHSKFPAQAIPSKLMWVQPVKNEWSTPAKMLFLRFCRKQPLVALICMYIRDVLHLFLCDTSTEEDVYINDVLKKAGHAVPCLPDNTTKGFGELNPAALYLKLKPPSAKELPSRKEESATAPHEKESKDISEDDPKLDHPAHGGKNEQVFWCKCGCFCG